MRQLKLSGRLSTAVGFVARGERVVDVGTDHGRTPVYLALNALAGDIFASDINEKPLRRARELAQEYAVEDKITFLLGDGLGAVGAGDVDTVIISGVGGETIARILSGASWLRAGDVKLIVQPQTKLPQLCDALDGGGFRIADVSLAEDSGRIYPVLLARADDQRAERRSARRDMFVICAEKNDPLLEEYVRKLTASVERAARGQAMSRESAAGARTSEEELRFLSETRDLIGGL